MGNQAQVAIILGITLLAEQKIWQGARKDIMAIAVKAAESMRPGGAGGDGLNLEVVKAFAGLLGTFVPAPLSTALSAGTAALDLVDAFKVPEPTHNDNVELTGWSVDEVYSSMVDLIKKVDTHVLDRESELDQKTLTGLFDYMWGQPASQFHINPGEGIEPDLKNAKQIDVHPEALKKVGHQLVSRVAAHMGQAAHDARGADQSGIWVRSGVGYGYSGPYNTWAQVLGEFDEVTTGSATELVEAGRLLAIGAGFLEDTDGSSKTELAGVRGDLARGEEGWVNKPPPPPPEWYTLPNGKKIPY